MNRRASLSYLLLSLAGAGLVAAQDDGVRLLGRAHPVHHPGMLYEARYAPDGSVLWTVGGDVRAWRAADGSPAGPARSLGEPATHDRRALSPDGRTAAAVRVADRVTIEIVDLETGRTRHVLDPIDSQVFSLAFAPDGRSLAVGSWQGELHLFDVEKGQLLVSLEAHEQLVQALAFHPGGRLVATGSSDGAVHVWDPLAERRVRTLLEGGPNVLGVAFDATGDRLAVGGDDGLARVLDAETGEEVFRSPPGRGSVYHVAFDPAGKHLAAGSGDRLVRVWEIDGRREVYRAAADGGDVPRVVFAPGGEVLAVVANLTRFVDAATWTDRPGQDGHLGAVASVAFGPRGERLYSASPDRTIRVWQVETGAEVAVFEPGERLGPLAVDPAGKLLAVGRWHSDVDLLDAATGALERRLAGAAADVRSLSFDAAGERLLSADALCTIRVWKVADGEVLLEERAAPVSADFPVAWWPDGRRVLHPRPVAEGGDPVPFAGPFDGLTTRSVGDDEDESTPIDVEGSPRFLATHPGGWLLSAHAGTVVEVWDLDGVERRHRLEVGWSPASVFTPDGERLILIEADRGVRIHAVGDGSLVRRIDLPGARSLAIDPAGRRLAVGLTDSRIALVDLADED